MIADAERLVAESRTNVRALTSEVYRILVEKGGCSAYVKTIYIGFEIAGEMVAALYPHAESVEIALALPEDHPSDLLVDATHLTWRSLPNAAELTMPDQIEQVEPLLIDAADRVRTAAHTVNREPEYFMGRSRRIANPRLIKGRVAADQVEDDDDG